MRIIKFILILCVKITLLAAALIVATYVLLHLIIIPYILIPRLNEALSAQTKQTVTITSLRLSPRGRITLDGLDMAPPSGAGVSVRVDRIVVRPQYRDIIRSWFKSNEAFQAPVGVAIDGVSVAARPVSITGAIAADITVMLERGATAQPDATGRVLLRDFVIREIPFFGDLSELRGTVLFSSAQITGEDLSGVLQGKPVNLAFSVNDLKQPAVEARLSFDQLTALCRLQYADDRLTVSQADIIYHETSLRASGVIAQLSGTQQAEMRAAVTLNLPDLQSLPSTYVAQLQRLQPAGVVSVAAQLNGPLKDPLQMGGNVDLTCPALSAGGYAARLISLHAQVRDGVCSVPEFRALFNESPITGNANIILKDPALPFTAAVQAGPLELASLRRVFAELPDLGGVAQARLDITGDARSAERIQAVLDATWRQASYANMKLPPDITAHASVKLEHMLNVIIEEVTVQDGITTLAGNGSIANLFSPAADLTANVTTDLARITQYPFVQPLKLPAVSGSPRLSLTIRGPIAQLATEPIPFSLSADSLVYDTFSLSGLAAHGTASPKAAALDDFQADFCGGTLTASGRVSLNDPKAGPFRILAVADKIDMAELSRTLPQLTTKPEGILSGRLSFEGSGLTLETCAGKAALEARWEQGRVQAIPLDEVRLKLESGLDRGSLSVDLLGINYGKLSLTGQGTYKNFLTSPEINASVQSSLDLEDLRLLPFSLPPQIKDFALKGVIALRAEAVGPFRAQTIAADWPQLQINAALVSDKLSIRGVVVQKLDCNAHLNNKLLHVSVLAQTYGGSVSLTSDADFLERDFDHKHALKIANVDIGALLRESKLIPQPHEGIILLNATLGGMGTALPTLQGTANLSLMKARLSGLEVLNATGELLQLPWLADFTVTQATGSATIKDALVTTDDLTLIGPQATVEARGTVDFDQRLNLLVRLLLSPEAVERTSRTVLDNFFTPEQDRYLTEIAVQGTLSAPQPDVNKFVQDRIKQRAQNEAKNLLQGEGKKLLEGLFKK